MSGMCGISGGWRFGTPDISPFQPSDREPSSVAEEVRRLVSPRWGLLIFYPETRGAAPGFRMLPRWGKWHAGIHHCSRHSRIGGGGGGSVHRHEG